MPLKSPISPIFLIGLQDMQQYQYVGDGKSPDLIFPCRMQLRKFPYGEEMQILQDLTDFVDGTFYSKVFTEWVQAERKYRTPLRNTGKQDRPW